MPAQTFKDYRFFVDCRFLEYLPTYIHQTTKSEEKKNETYTLFLSVVSRINDLFICPHKLSYYYNLFRFLAIPYFWYKTKSVIFLTYI